MTKSPDPRGGFTLIELLVAVIIAAILIGLIVAGVGRWSSQTQSVQCIANLRSLHSGILAYGVDHGMEVPVDRENFASGMTWYMAVMKYVKCPTSGDPWKNPYLCPGNPNTKSEFVGWTNYAINGNIYSGGTNLNDPPAGTDAGAHMRSRKAMRLTQIDGDKVLLIDSFNGVNRTWYGNDGARWGSGWPDCYAVHGDGVNVLFVNGSIRRIKVAPRTINATLDLNELKAEWFWPLQNQ